MHARQKRLVLAVFSRTVGGFIQFCLRPASSLDRPLSAAPGRISGDPGDEAAQQRRARWKYVSCVLDTGLPGLSRACAKRTNCAFKNRIIEPVNDWWRQNLGEPALVTSRKKVRCACCRDM